MGGPRRRGGGGRADRLREEAGQTGLDLAQGVLDAARRAERDARPRDLPCQHREQCLVAVHEEDVAMCMRRVDMDRLQELVRLHRMGTGVREVARLVSMSPNTERAYREALARERAAAAAGRPVALARLAGVPPAA